MRPRMKSLAVAICVFVAVTGRAADTLDSLVGLIGNSSDTQFQLDVLRGLREATQGRQQVPMPPQWDAVEPRLLSSDQAEVRSLARNLGLTFGSQKALAALRSTVSDRTIDAAQRQDAMRALLGIRDASLPEQLRALLQEPAMRGAAVRALATFDDPATAPALLAAYGSFSGSEKRDALGTLASRPNYARPLLAAVAAGTVSTKDLTAELVRQLRNLKDEEINATLTKVYGTFREVNADKQSEIDRFKRIFRAGGSTPGDAIRGRAAYAKVCQQCHTLFDIGGKVGPDLTGSNRGDLDYILQNIIDPNAVIPNEYLASTFELKDGRVVTGILKQQDDKSMTVATATETVSLSRSDITEIQQSQLSMMPEGLLTPLADQEFRDLIYYLSRTGQAPMLGTTDTINLFYSGRDLTLWQADETQWKVKDGEIIGQLPETTPADSYLRSEMILADFHLSLKVRLTQDQPVAGLFFRAEPTPDGGVRGYRIALGGNQWGQLREQGGRPELSANPPGAASKPSNWNQLEITATGGSIRATLNGKPCFELQDVAGSRRGIVAFQLNRGATSDLRIKDLHVELLGETQPATQAKSSN
jgi:putative heme-binding domain-containing protein